MSQGQAVGHTVCVNISFPFFKKKSPDLMCIYLHSGNNCVTRF